MSVASLQWELEDAMQDFVRACQQYEDCLHPRTSSLTVDRRAYSAMCDELDETRKQRRKAVREIVNQLKALPGGHGAVTEARRRLDAWARDNGYQDVLRTYEPLA
ncbi:MAG: hypothetical protein K1X65_12545 [Caldilineales bacterium]|nr:hypothetical protein [Caldilineales bacterium]MCW5858571.1 hypothetical protein [Caldilineales bacterium]